VGLKADWSYYLVVLKAEHYKIYCWKRELYFKWNLSLVSDYGSYVTRTQYI